MHRDSRRSVTPTAGRDVRLGRALAATLVMVAGCQLRAQTPAVAARLTFNSFGSHLLAAAVDRAGAADSNVVLSPVSAGLALSLASLGARGGTASALASVLGTPDANRATLAERGAALIASSTDRHDVELEIANAIWTDSRARLAARFATLATTWHARVGSIALHSPAAVTAINDWASAATHGKIAGVLTKPLPDTTILFIANAVYFKGKWATPFDSSATRPHGFTLRSGRRVNVPMMHRTGKLLYWRESGYQMVSLPYEGGQVAMYVILPDGSDATALASRFAAHGFPVNLSAPSARLVNLTLPRLHVEQKIDLGPLLERLGAGIAFDCRRADFGDMALDSSGQPYHPLCIGKATQNVYFDVDEKGTEAAAVTGIGMVTATAAQIPIDFVVDRPFLLVLRDKSTGANLFVASIRHP